MSDLIYIDLAKAISRVLSDNRVPDPATLRCLDTTLGALSQEELQSRLDDPDDSEAQVIRELLLFPDQELAMVAEAVLLEHGETGIGHGEVSLLARELDGARALWLLTSGADEALELSLDAKDCVLLMKRLRLDEQLPQELCQAASEWAREPELTLLARVRCRQRGLAWSGLQTGLASRLIRGAFQKIFDQVRFLDVVNWGLEFLRPYDARMYTAAEKAAVAMDMAIQRDELERQMELAVRMTKVRETYNFETRRMLGIVEPHLHLADVETQLELMLLAAQAMFMGRLPSTGPGVRDLGQAEEVEDLSRIFLME